MIRAIVVEDEELSRQRLVRNLEEVDVTVVASFSSGEKMMKELAMIDFDVAFLDIEMPMINGLELSSEIQKWKPTVQIVFVTGYTDYAVAAFEQDTVDYILKPILRHRLEKTIARVKKKLEQTNSLSVPPKVMENAPLQINCFHHFSVKIYNTPVKWKTLKVKELFAYLFMHLNTPVHRDTIIDQLWTNHEYRKAKIQLHTSLTYLRKLLATIGTEESITFSSQYYQLSLANYQCDADTFEHTLDTCHAVNHETINTIEKTLELYTGGYLEQEGYEWAHAKASYLHERMIVQLDRLASYFEEAGLSSSQIKYLHWLQRLSPYAEHVVQKLMIAYTKAGSRAKALQVYEHFKATILNDIGLEPEEKTQRLYARIQHGQ
ncbi:response regulator [Alkalihalobacillus oceani]|uniref:Response regulator n=1 Tax=Halalkalibacter oceani TaxID=1653776 RepID=A0A9X2IP52_9BACI|nr:response regulator [Halalkalibacter oceani]MCM3715639.1 response regulator [Halalkalibacter oceani]